MYYTPLAELAKTIKAFDLPSDVVVNVHSSLLPFGILEGGVAGAYTALRDALGPNATILMPAFTWSFPNTNVWDCETTPSTSGALTEFFRQQPGTDRTVHPFHSMSVTGPLWYEFTACDCLSSFGANSPFDVLKKLDGYNLQLGIGFIGGVTFVHGVEEELQVPYRYMKQFPGTVYGPRRTLPHTYEMYVRHIEPQYEWVNCWDEVFAQLVREDCFRTLNCGKAKLTLCHVPTTYNALRRHILASPFYAADINDLR